MHAPRVGPAPDRRDPRALKTARSASDRTDRTEPLLRIPGKGPSLDGVARIHGARPRSGLARLPDCLDDPRRRPGAARQPQRSPKPPPPWDSPSRPPGIPPLLGDRRRFTPRSTTWRCRPEPGAGRGPAGRRRASSTDSPPTYLLTRAKSAGVPLDRGVRLDRLETVRAILAGPEVRPFAPGSNLEDPIARDYLALGSCPLVAQGPDDRDGARRHALASHPRPGSPGRGPKPGGIGRSDRPRRAGSGPVSSC